MLVRRMISPITVMCGALLVAAPVLASDGEILIDQAKVNAGGITPGDSPGFPATLSRAGRYKLTGNLNVPADQTGIQVTRDDVTIDLNGFTISSSSPGAAHMAVHSANVTGLRVLNGTVTGFASYGVYNEGGLAVVENMRVIASGTGIYIGKESQIRTTTVANGIRGISAASQSQIEDSIITGNTGEGIVEFGGGGAVLGNVIAFNGNYGLLSVGGPPTGYGNNILVNNNGGAQGAVGAVVQLHPNVCEPACP